MRRWIQNQEGNEIVCSVVHRPISNDVVVQTLEQVSHDIFHAFQRHFPGYECETLLSKLTEYRLVDRVCDLHKGRYIRWVRLDDSTPLLHKGAVAVNVVFSDEGTFIRCKITRSGFMQCRFDQCLVFERLTEEEQLIMAATQRFVST